MIFILHIKTHMRSILGPFAFVTCRQPGLYCSFWFCATRRNILLVGVSLCVSFDGVHFSPLTVTTTKYLARNI